MNCFSVGRRSVFTPSRSTPNCFGIGISMTGPISMGCVKTRLKESGFETSETMSVSGIIIWKCALAEKAPASNVIKVKETTLFFMAKAFVITISIKIILKTAISIEGAFSDGRETGENEHVP